MYSNLNDYQNRPYIHRLLHMTHMLIMNQNPVMDTKNIERNANISGFSSPSSMSCGEILWDLGGTLNDARVEAKWGSRREEEKIQKPNHHSCWAEGQLDVQNTPGTSLVGQWLRNHPPMQGTWVQSLVHELRSHMPRGQKPMCHNYWALALGACVLTQEKPLGIATKE